MQGKADQQYQLGLNFYNGDIADREESEKPFLKLVALELWEKIAKPEDGQQGHLLAQYAVGICHKHGLGVAKDVKKAAEFFLLAATQGDPSAQYEIGLRYFKGNGGLSMDAKKAAEFFKLAATKGHAMAQYSLGVCFDHGEGVDKDIKRAVELYQLAADNGSVNAQTHLGVCHFNGNGGVTKDVSHAVKLFQLAVNQQVTQNKKCAPEIFQELPNQEEVAKSQFYLGCCYRDGLGVTKDEKRAMELFQLAAKNGNAAAQYNLGVQYLWGQGVSEDKKRAIELFKLAVNQGHDLSQFSLGLCYEHGIGIEQDEKLAVELYQLAANQGNTKAKEILQHLEKNTSSSSVAKNRPG